MSINATEGIGWESIDRLSVCMLMTYPSAKQPASLRHKGWTVAEYDGSRPCLPTVAIRAVAARLAKKKGAA